MFYYPTNNLEKKIVKSKVLIGNYPYTVVFTPTALHHTCSNVHKRKITITAIPDTLSLLNILTLAMEKIYLDIEGTDLFQPLPTKDNMALASIRVEADKAISHYCNTVGREFESPYINTTLYQKDKFSTFMENITTINRSYFIALLKAPMGFTSVEGYDPSLLLHVSLDIKTNRGIPATSYIAGLNLEYGLGNKRVLIYMGCTDNRFNFHSIRTITRLTRMPIDIGIEITLDKIEKLEYCLNN
jgi:hypothetical protein